MNLKSTLFILVFFLGGIAWQNPLKAQNQNNAGTDLIFPIASKNHDKQTKKKATPYLKNSTSVLSVFNDDCVTATNVPFYTVLVDSATSFNNQSLPPATCGGATSLVANDAWFKFTKTAAMDTFRVMPLTTDADVVLEVFSGTCSGLTSLACADGGGAGTSEGFIITNLTLGTTYYFRVYGYDGGDAKFYALITPVVVTPSNNDCSGVLSLTGSISCAAVVSGSTFGATQSTTPILCNGFTGVSDDDVWYSFVKTATSDSIIVSPFGTFDPVVDLRSGTCVSSSNLLCSDDPVNGSAIEKIYVGGLTNGTTYFVRVYSYSNALTSKGNFTICLKNKANGAPTNDNCASSALVSAGILTSGSSLNATTSIFSPIQCGNFTSTTANDVWYRFTKSALTDTLIITPSLGYDPVVDLRSNNCSTGINVACSDAGGGNVVEKILLTALTNGVTYLFRVYGYNGIEGDFTILLKDAAGGLPLNDDCLSANTVTAGVLAAGSSLNATQTISPILCNGFTSTQANDVWFKFTKSALTDTLIITPLDFDPVLELRSNSCTAGVNIACSDIVGSGVIEKVVLSSLTNGITYLFRVYGFSGLEGNFNILLKDAVIVAPPQNDVCTSATALTVGSSCQFVPGTNVGATSTALAAASCSGTGAGEAKDVWYTFVANGAQAIINLECGVGFDGAVTLYSGACANPTQIGCADVFGASTSTSTATEVINVSGLTQGLTYRIRVYGYQAAEGTFNVCVFNPGCTSTIGALTASASTVISNQSFAVNVSGANGIISYEYSSDQVSWTPYTGLSSPPDTMNFNGTISGTLYLRAISQAGNCFPATSAVLPLTFRCATPFTNPLTTTNDFIKQVQINTINQFSGENLLGGNVQDFTAVSTTLCRGSSYPITIGTNYSGVPYNRMVWIDLNQDGDFADAGENVHFGPYMTSAALTTTPNITIPNSATVGTTRMRVAIISNGATITSADPCSAGPYNLGEIEEYTVNISIGVTADAGNTQDICSPSATLSGNNPGNNVGNWTVVSGSGVFANASQYNTQVSGLSNGLNIFKWTIVSGCGTTNSNVLINYFPLSATVDQDFTVCSGFGNLSATAPNIGNGSWSLLSGSGTITTPNLPNSTVSGLGIGVNKFLWTVSSGSCPSAKDTLTITRMNDPSNADAGQDQLQCANSATLSAVSPQLGVGQWSVLQGTGTVTNPGSANSTVTGLSNGINRFRWTVSNGNCTPKTDDITVTVAVPPNAQAGQDQSICTTNVQLSGNVPLNTTTQWDLISGSGTITNSTAASTGVTNVGIGQNIFTYTLTKPNCPVDVDTIIVIRKAISTAFAGQDQTLCTNTATLTASVPSDGTGLWTRISGSGTIANSTNAIAQVSGLGIGDNIFRWTVTNSPCAPVFDEVTITTTGNAVTANAGNDATICAGNYNVVANSPGTGTGLWTVVNGSGIITSPTNPSTQITGLGVGINVFRWTISNGICPPSSDDVMISRTAATTVANAGQDQSLCATTAILGANTPSQGTGLWSVVSGSGTFADATNATTSVSGLGAGNNTFRWTITNAPCTASIDDVVIATSASSTTANAGLDQVNCNDVATLSGNAALQGSGQWTVVSGSGIFALASDPNTQVTGLGTGVNIFRWSITNGACPTSIDEVSITRKADASIPNAGLDQNICTSTATISASAVTIGIGTWTLVSGTGTIINPNTSNTQVTGLGAGANVFRFTVTNPPCQPVSDDVTINSTLAATTSLAGADQTLCNNTTILSGNNPQTGSGLWTVVSGSGTFTDANSQNTSVTNLGSGTNVFRWTITSGNCAPSTDDVSVVVKTTPTQANAGNDQTLCGSSATLAANQALNGTGKWILVSGSGLFVNDADPSSQVINLGNGANTFRWTISNAPCTATQDEVVITSTPANVTADAGSDKIVCGTTANLTATSPTIGNGTWSVISGTGIISQPGQAVTSITGLGIGPNQFLWTVVNGSCSATDVVNITRESNPVQLGHDTLFCVEVNPIYVLSAPAGMTSYQWNTAAVSNQITVSQTGSYSVRVVTPNQCTFSDTVLVTFSICTDLEATVTAAKPEMQIVPNPSVAAASLWIQLPKQEKVTVAIYDLKGMQIAPSTVYMGFEKTMVTLPDYLSSGTYVVKITGQSFAKSLKWVIEK